jgi:multidrug efflux system membrane fusion protein
MTADTTVIGPERQLPAPARRPRLRRWVLLTILGASAAIVAIVLARHGARTRTAPPSAPPTTVTVAVADRGDVPVHLDSIGTVTPLYTANVTSQVTGQITAVHYTEGQRVEKGHPLIDLDARPFRATLLQAEGALERDRNVLAQAEMDLERYQVAWSRRAIAKQQLDDQEKLVLQAKGTVKNDEGTVRFAEVQLGYAHITAPIAGRVGLRLVDPGNLVQASSTTPLVVITEDRPITVVFTVSEDDLGELRTRLKQNATLPLEALDRSAQKTIASGTFLTLDNQIDTTTGTVKGRALFANADGALFPNQFVNVRLLVDTRRNVTRVPMSSIQQNGTESFVYIIKDGVAHMRKVVRGVTDTGRAHVDGVAPGEAVATSSFDRLRDGGKVTVMAARAPSSVSPDGGAP